MHSTLFIAVQHRVRWLSQNDDPRPLQTHSARLIE